MKPEFMSWTEEKVDKQLQSFDQDPADFISLTAKRHFLARRHFDGGYETEGEKPMCVVYDNVVCCANWICLLGSECPCFT